MASLDNGPTTITSGATGSIIGVATIVADVGLGFTGAAGATATANTAAAIGATDDVGAALVILVR